MTEMMNREAAAATATLAHPVPDRHGTSLFDADPQLAAVSAVYLPPDLHRHLLPHRPKEPILRPVVCLLGHQSRQSHRQEWAGHQTMLRSADLSQESGRRMPDSGHRPVVGKPWAVRQLQWPNRQTVGQLRRNLASSHH